MTGRTTLVSVGVTGGQGNGESRQGSISADGRFVAFNSNATNLFPGDTNNSPDVFVRDLHTGRTTLASVGTGGGLADNGAHQPEISADGRHVVFTSGSTNLVAGDTNDTEDVFVRDLRSRRTERVSLTADGQQRDIYSREPAISGDGRFVAFVTEGPSLAVHDRKKNTTRVVSEGVTVDPQSFMTEIGYPSFSDDGRFLLFTVIGWLGPDPVPNVWLRDLQTNGLELVSTDHLGRPSSAIGPVFRGDVSADGRYVTFGTPGRMTPADQGDLSDVFRLDRKTGTRVWISRGQDQTAGGNGSVGPAISSDGKHVAFESDNPTLIPNGAGLQTYEWSSTRPR
nr:hypothetical protein [Streptomyces sp. SID13031]